MRKASFSVEKPTSHTIAHNTREDAPKYLIGLAEGRENLYEEYYSFENFQALAEARYLEVHKQKMQTSQKEALFEEALISLEEHHTKDDVIKLFEALNKKYTGHTLINLAIHNDEGHFVRDGIEYYPTKHILEKEDGWYILDENDTHILEALKDKDFKPKAEDFKIKVNIKDFEKVYNYHAHAVFSRFDLETGKSARFQKGTMSERYKFVAEQMKMKYAPEENRLVKKSIGQYKADLSATRNAKLVLKKELEKVHLEEKTILKKEITSLKSQNTKSKNEKHKLKEANKALEKQLKEANNKLRAFMKENQAVRTDYAPLEAEKKILEEKLKAKTLTEKELLEKFQELEENFKTTLAQKDKFLGNLQEIGKEISKETPIKTISEIPEAVKTVLTQNKSLEEQKEVLASKVIELEQKTAPEPNMSDYEDIKYELEDNKENIKVFENHYNLPKTGNLIKLLNWVDSKLKEFSKLLRKKDAEIKELKEEIKELREAKKESLNIVSNLQSEAKRDIDDTRESDSSFQKNNSEKSNTKKRDFGRDI